jgi:hypothetical protein
MLALGNTSHDPIAETAPGCIESRALIIARKIIDKKRRFLIRFRNKGGGEEAQNKNTRNTEKARCDFHPSILSGRAESVEPLARI